MLTREHLRQISEHVEEALQVSIVETDGVLHQLLEQATLEVARLMKAQAGDSRKAA